MKSKREWLKDEGRRTRTGRDGKTTDSELYNLTSIRVGVGG